LAVTWALQTSAWEDQGNDESREELTHSINLIREAKRISRCEIMGFTKQHGKTYIER
jgi:hypothetical protein